jgi:uncharacterized protein YfiM (DUF2279 family)
MEHFTVAVTPEKKRTWRWSRFLWRLLLASIAILLFLAFDFSPSVPAPKPPTAEQARRARDLASQAQTALGYGGGFASIRADREDLKSAASLANALGHFGRVDANIADKQLTLLASRPLGPVWLNVRAVIGTSAKGFPETHLTIGDLPLGKTFSRWVVQRARWLVRRRGVDVPPLDDLVRAVTIQPDAMVATIHLPPKGAFANSLSGLRDQPVNAVETATIYCALRESNRKTPTDDMAIIVQRAFAAQSGKLSATEANRATFVALAMYAADPSAGRLAGDAAQRVRGCKGQRDAPLLAGRTDLAAHWSLSAALAVSLGDDIGRAMGEWKELSDSRPGGTGFSFVDLAADRAGLDAARRATDPARADAVATQMRAATQERLLPIRALALSEGLTEADFVARFRNVDSKQFDAAKAKIDRVLAQRQ